MVVTSPKKIAILGAGITGISCARKLTDFGHDVVLIDKGRGIGGRMATRRAGDYHFDHGVQYIEAQREAFENLLFKANQDYAVSQWQPKFSNMADNTEHTTLSEDESYYVGMPRMTAFARYLAEDLDITTSTRVIELQHQDARWILILEDESNWGDFDIVIVTVPPLQAFELVSSFSQQFEALQSVVMAPCWAGLYAFADQLKMPFDAYRANIGPIAWACRNSSKPGRATAHDCWVVHAGKDWTRSHLNLPKEDIAELLLKEFQEISSLESLGKRLYQDAHRWLYAFVETPLGQPFIYDKDIQLAVAGDWCLGARVEAGFESGTALANAILTQTDE